VKIAIILPGGITRNLQQNVIPVMAWLVERLARKHDVHVFTLVPQAEPAHPVVGATLHPMGYPRRSTATVLTRGLHFVRALQQHGPFDVLHGLTGLPGIALAVLGGRMLNIPSVVSLVGGEVVRLPDIGYGALLSPSGRLMMRWVMRRATHVTACTQFLQRMAQPFRAQVDVVPLGVDGAYFELGANRVARAPNDPIKLLHVASLNRVKDQTTLLNAMQRVVRVQPNVHLDIIGSDTLNGAVQRHCAALGLNTFVTFHNFISPNALMPYWRDADALVMSSRHEGQCVAVCEAAATRVPTVGTRVGLLADWGPERAIAVPVGDDAALAEGMLRLMRNPALRTQLAQAAQAWAREYDADWTANAFERIYTRLQQP
jgi:glycosyltransferase involved in cell wall biosynthesis